IIAKKNTGPHAPTNPCGSKPSTECPRPSWKIHSATPTAAALASRLVTTPSAAITGACSATISSRKRRASTTANISGVLTDRAVALPRVGAGRNDLDRGHRGLQRQHRQREQHEHRERRHAVAQRLAPEPLSPRRGAWRTVIPRADPRKREPVHARPELRQHG